MAIVKLLSKETVAEGTMAFTFEKPEGFTFTPGQHVELKLINPPETDEEGNGRIFSIVSGKNENNLTVATRMRDTAFKRVLGAMEPGATLEMSDAMGSFTLHKNTDKTAVFLMGGIGITPTVSMLRSATEEKLPHKLMLFYSNRRPEDAAFLKELQDMRAQNPNYTFVGTMTEMEKSTQPWDGETGYITADMVKRHVPEEAFPSAIWYISGPAKMVNAMRDVLAQLNVDEDNIRTEEFSGY